MLFSLRAFIRPWVKNGAVHGAAFPAHVEQVPVPTLSPGDIAVMDNLSAHNSVAVRAAIKSFFGKTAARTVDELRHAIAQATETFTPTENQSIFAAQVTVPMIGKYRSPSR